MISAFAPLPPAALSRILSSFDRRTLSGFIEVAIGLLDIADGDPDFEEIGAEDSFLAHHFDGPGCPVTDPGGPSWLGRTNQTRALLIKGTAHFQSHEDAEDDDPREANGDERDSNNAEDEELFAAFGYGPGCPLADPGGCELEL